MSRNQNSDRHDSPSRKPPIFMSPEDAASGKKSNWPELEITGTVRNLSPSLWRLTHLTSLYINDNNLTKIPREISRLSSLVYLDLSGNKLRSIPSELGDLIYLRNLLLNNNYLRNLPFEIGKLFQLQNLELKNNPLSYEILSLYIEPNGTSKLLQYLLDNLPVGASHPPQRPWIVTNYRHSKVACMFTILCYNVLCDKYATRQMYRYCPTWALDWDYRKKTILDEIQHYSADIIALQEVETDQFYHFFLPELKKHGYDGIFSPKSRAKTMSEKERVHVDGCAIFFRINKFSLLKMHLVEFNQLAMANADGSDDMLNRVMTKDNIGLAALLETKKGAWETEPTDTSICHQPLLVCTCHIHWDPEYCDVKLIQTMMLMNELKHIADDISNEIPGQKASNVNLLLCGDFNSLPDSGTVQFLTSGFIPVNHPDFKELGYKSCLKKLCVLDKQNQFSHPFHLVSAYGNGVMPYTNYTFDFKGVIDYMFFTKTGLRNLGLLGPVDPEWLKKNKIVGCPHPHIPSDHFPLLVEMELIPPKSPSNGLVLRR